MERRRFAWMGFGLLLAPIVARPQPVAHPRRIGLLSPDDIGKWQRDDMRAKLAERGWIEGNNLVVDSRSAKGEISRLRTLADELVKSRVELIIGFGTIASQAAKQATTRVPIIIYASADPVRAGLVSSLARPGGNLTGTTIAGAEVTIKRLELLREVLPSAKNIGLLVNRTNPASNAARVNEESKSLGLNLMFAEVGSGGEIEGAALELARRGAQALVLNADTLLNRNRKQVLGVAEQHRIPVLVAELDEPDGALISFDVDWEDVDRQLATYVDLVLKGGNPATMAIEGPSRFKVSIDLRRAKALGINIPASVLLRADKVHQ
jgi:putative ABC transport system substrate-binding protein